jgi:Ca2+-transporting ATPase
MSFAASSICIHAKLIRNLKENKARTGAPNQDEAQPQEQDVTDAANSPQTNRKHADNFSIEQDNINTILSPQLKCLFNQSITLNSTAFEDVDPETQQLAFVRAKTETTLLQSGRYHLFLKGASEILTKKCTHQIIISKNPDYSQHTDSEIETKALDEITKDNIPRTIIFYANQMLRTIALCYRDFESWPPTGTYFQSPNEVPYEDASRDMTPAAITGTEDPLRPNAREAVATCHHAGVTVKMCTGDNVPAACPTATRCGIDTTGGITMEGPVSRALDPQERVEDVPRLQAPARPSPEDKKILAETLRSLGETAGATGDGTNDGPALKTAYVGFSTVLPVLRSPKRHPSIILMDDNFASIVKAIMRGRCVNDAVREFLRFQISTNITAVILTFVSAVSSNGEEPVLTAVQLLWINIIMDTFAALALATDPASKSLLDQETGYPRNETFHR